MTRRVSIQALVLAALLCVLAAPHAFAGWTSLGKVNASPALLNEKFGCSVAIDGSWMAVGASDSTIGQARSTGAVHLFKFVDGSWVFRQSIFHPEPLSFQAFGNAVALRGDTLAVASWGSGQFAGAVFTFQLGADDVWQLDATLTASDPQPAKAALFGWSMSLDVPPGAPPVIAVGRPNDSKGSLGAIYVFERAEGGWAQVAKVTAPNATTGDQLGLNVSVCGGTICSGLTKRKCVTVFERVEGAWSSGVELTDTAATASDGFGTSVASGGTFVAVGAPSRAATNASVAKAGAVTIFERSRGAWQRVAGIASSDPVSGDSFGYALAAARTGEGDRATLIIAAPGRDTPTTDAGAAFCYQRNGDGDWRKSDTDLWSTAALATQMSGKFLAVSSNGRTAALASDLPRGSIGGAFPMRLDAGTSGTRVPPHDSGSDGSDGDGNGNGAGGSGGGGDNGGSSGGTGDNPTDSFGQGGKPRPITPLPALEAPFGTVASTLVFDGGMGGVIMGLQTDGGSPRGRVISLATRPDGWRLAALGDVNGDGGGDFVWQDQARSIRAWTRDGSTFLTKETLRGLGPNEEVVACVDFDGDGVDDVITRDAVAKLVTAIRMREGKATGTEYTVNMPSAAWQVLPQRLAGGLLLRHPKSGAVKRATRDAISGEVRLADAPSPVAGEQIEAVGDFDGDGVDDLISRHPDSGDVRIWFQDKDGALVRSEVLCLDGEQWDIVAANDWNGDGTSDLLLRTDGSRRLVVLYLEHRDDGVTHFLKNYRVGNLGNAELLGVLDR